MTLSLASAFYLAMASGLAGERATSRSQAVRLICLNHP
jgi:hypothetical protein